MSAQEELKSEVAAAIRPLIEATGNFLEEITIQTIGKRRLITVIVDSEKHLNLDQVTVVTKEISEFIEGLEALGDIPFTLEVTSPGVDRPLTLPRHWVKNNGRLVNAVLTDGSEISGRIGAATSNAVNLGEKLYDFSLINKALIEIEFKSINAEVDE